MRRKLLIFLSVITMFFLLAANIPAAPKLVRVHASQLIKKTAVVIVAAQKAAIQGRHYKGLARSIAHQSYARKLFIGGFYEEAIYHSLRARHLAVAVIKLNKAEMVKEAVFDQVEEQYRKMPLLIRNLTKRLKLKKRFIWRLTLKKTRKPLN